MHTRRRPFAPQRVDQPVARDDFVGMKEKEREQRALLASSEGSGCAVQAHLEGAEDAALHTATKAFPQAFFQVFARQVGDPWREDRTDAKED